MQKFKLTGLASQKSLMTFSKSEWPIEISLMEFLISKGFPIASSCNGEGQCKKCVINEDILSCQVKQTDALHNLNISEEEFNNEIVITISYL